MNLTFLQNPTILFLVMLFLIFFMPLLSRLIYIPSIIGLILGGLIFGPHVLNLLPLNATTELFASIGVIYLMFNVGLEINLDQLSSNRVRTIIFYLLTYLLPLISSILIGWIFGLNLNSSILLGAIYASYTLVAYPIITELGILKNEAVAIPVCAVVLTDITALLTLNLKNAVKSATNVYCTEFASFFGDLSLHRMGDTISAKNRQKSLQIQHISRSRHDSTVFFRIMATSHYQKPGSKFESIKKSGTQFIKLKNDIVGAVSEIAKEDDLIIIPSMNVQKRFNTNKNHVPYGLLHQTKSSIMIIHLPK